MNQFGNFVVQNALKCALSPEREKLSEQIEKYIPNITDPKIKGKWLQLLKKGGNTYTSKHSNSKSLATFNFQQGAVTEEEVEEVCREQAAKVAVILQLIREVVINFRPLTLSSRQATAITLRLKIRFHLGNNLLIM